MPNSAFDGSIYIRKESEEEGGDGFVEFIQPEHTKKCIYLEALKI